MVRAPSPSPTTRTAWVALGTSSFPHPAQPQGLVLDVSSSGYWYDFTVTTACVTSSTNTTGSYSRRVAGKMETGKTTTTDPAMGASPSESDRPTGAHGVNPHPILPAHLLGPFPVTVSGGVEEGGEECSRNDKDSCFSPSLLDF